MIKRAKICLFTAFAPSGGGGGTNIRSLLPELAKSFQIAWRYTSEKAAVEFNDGWVGKPIVGGGHLLTDMFKTAALLRDHSSAALETVVHELLATNCDAYWIVSHNEGMRVAWELTKKSSRPVHLTIQDDWAGALCARSWRYRALAPFADQLSDKTIRAVWSFDVTSDGMWKYYRDRLHIDGVVMHPLIPGGLPNFKEPQPETLTVGHVGSIYSKKEFIAFANALASFGAKTERSVAIKMWGGHLKVSDLPKQLRRIVHLAPSCAEAEVVRELARCHFVYAMYPFRRALKRFVTTSLPTKLSTYVQAQRPILGHGPEMSTLTTFLSRTGTGGLWTDMAREKGERAIGVVLDLNLDAERWKLAYDLYYGKANSAKMLKVLDQLVRGSCYRNGGEHAASR